MNIFFRFLLLQMALFILICSTSLFALNIENLQGVYKHKFTNALIDETKYESEDILEVLKYTNSSIYFRIHLDFFNGHVCNLWGIATQKDNHFLYQAADNKCRISFKETEKELILNDESEGKCQNYCGARGTLNDVHFKKNWRRTIKYMPLILKSNEYRDAIEDYSWIVEPQIKTTFWANGKIKTQEPIVKNVKHGIYKSYREDGSLLEEISYVQGKKFGISRSYFPNGKIEYYSDNLGENNVLLSAKFNESGFVIEISSLGEVTKCVQPAVFNENSIILTSRCHDK